VNDARIVAIADGFNNLSKRFSISFGKL